MEKLAILLSCVAGIAFWLMMPMGMYVVCKLMQERRLDRDMAILIMFCCAGIGHFMAVQELAEHGSRWRSDPANWLYPLLLYPYVIAFLLQVVLRIVVSLG
ncbi:MAG: hypothetical protein K6T86_16990 [Pirellulales bacterium]|nr:hypothetical protein [Pirellulales bacterium]